MDSLTIDADRESRIFQIVGNEETQVELTGLALTGGYGYTGGGIYSLGASLQLTDCLLEYNAAEYGGGIYSGGTLQIVNSGLIGNHAQSSGGGILTGGGTTTITDSWLIQNTAGGSGGALYTSSGEAILSNTIFGENFAGGSGGAIYVNGKSTEGIFDMTNCTVSENGSLGGAGGIAGLVNYAAAITINNSLVAGNISENGEALDTSLSGENIDGANNLIGAAGKNNPFLDGVDGNLVGTSETPIDALLSDCTLLDNGFVGLLPPSRQPRPRRGVTTLWLWIRTEIRLWRTPPVRRGFRTGPSTLAPSRGRCRYGRDRCTQ